MKEHNKITFAKEYCLCRRIPYKFHNETLIIGSKDYLYKTIYSVYNLPWNEITSAIDDLVCYNEYGYFSRVRTSAHSKIILGK